MLPLGLDLAPRLLCRTLGLLQLRQLLVQGGDLALVGPSEHPGARIIDTRAVVLLMSFARADLPLAGDGASFLSELSEGVDTSVVGALDQLIGQVVGEISGFGLQAVCEDQVVVGRLPDRDTAFWNALVDQLRADLATVPAAEAESSSVDPPRNLVVVDLGDQQGKREPAKHSLGGAAPLALFLDDVEQLAGIRKLLRRQPKVPAELLPQIGVGSRQVAGPLGQAVELIGEDPGFAIDARDLAQQAGCLMADLAAPRFELGPLVGDVGGERAEVARALDRCVARLVDGGVEQRAALGAFFGLFMSGPGQALEFADPVTAGPRPFGDQFVPLGLQASGQRLDARTSR